MDRVILHCDLNNFYASVECLYHRSSGNFRWQSAAIPTSATALYWLKTRSPGASG